MSLQQPNSLKQITRGKRIDRGVRAMMLVQIPTLADHRDGSVRTDQQDENISIPHQDARVIISQQGERAIISQQDKRAIISQKDKIIYYMTTVYSQF